MSTLLHNDEANFSISRAAVQVLFGKQHRLISFKDCSFAD